MGPDTPLPFVALQEQTTGRSKADFVALYPHPFLLLESASTGAVSNTSGAFKTQVTPGSSSGEIRKGDTTRRFTSGAPAGDSLGRIYKVTKRGVNSFATMITVGRAKNNDVDLDNTSISKFHAYLMQAPTGWVIVDVKSANGTFVNGEQLAPQTQRRLRDGDSIRFGVEVSARFFESGAFFEFLRGSLT